MQEIKKVIKDIMIKQLYFEDVIHNGNRYIFLTHLCPFSKSKFNLYKA